MNPGSLLRAFERLKRTGLLDSDGANPKTRGEANIIRILTRRAAADHDLKTNSKTKSQPIPSH